MIDLSNREEIKKLDPKDVYGSTTLFVEQCLQMVQEYFDKDLFPKDYREAKNLVICGMGGSAYGGHIVRSLYKEQLTIPVETNSSYTLPGYVNDQSITLLTSYSGSTEEVLHMGEKAKKLGAKITGFSSGGKLGEFLKNSYPGFTFNPKNNPSGQPRLGTGYIVLGTLIMLKNLGIIPLSKDELLNAIQETAAAQDEIKKEATALAEKIINNIPVIFASEHLEGNAHILRNQLNETAKSFSAFQDVPELNHHLMEGLTNPKDKKLTMLFLDSNNYSPINQKRMQLTKDVVVKNNVPFVSYTPKGNSKLTQMLTTLSFGGYLSLYLALLYGLDPSLIPWVDYFKEELKK